MLYILINTHGLGAYADSIIHSCIYTSDLIVSPFELVIVTRDTEKCFLSHCTQGVEDDWKQHTSK